MHSFSQPFYPLLFLRAYIPLGEPKEAAVYGAGYKRMGQEKTVSRPKVVSQRDILLEPNVYKNHLQDCKIELMWILSSLV